MVAIAAKLPPLLTIAEFVDWRGEQGDANYELVDGVPRAMAPASDKHATIVSNINFLLAADLRTRLPGCRVVTAPGVQPRLRSEWNFRVPDLGVTCTPNRAGDVMTPDPVLLVEVLSPSNAAITWGNIPLYASLPSVREILIVHASSVRVEMLRRDDRGDWPADPELVEGLESSVRLGSISLVLPLVEIYRNTHLATS